MVAPMVITRELFSEAYSALITLIYAPVEIYQEIEIPMISIKTAQPAISADKTDLLNVLMPYPDYKPRTPYQKRPPR